MKLDLGTLVVIRFTEHYTHPTSFRERLWKHLRASLHTQLYTDFIGQIGEAEMNPISSNSYRGILEGAL